jgi:hypothetical protein
MAVRIPQTVPPRHPTGAHSLRQRLLPRPSVPSSPSAECPCEEHHAVGQGDRLSLGEPQDRGPRSTRDVSAAEAPGISLVVRREPSEGVDARRSTLWLVSGRTSSTSVFSGTSLLSCSYADTLRSRGMAARLPDNALARVAQGPGPSADMLASSSPARSPPASAIVSAQLRHKRRGSARRSRRTPPWAAASAGRRAALRRHMNRPRPRAPPPRLSAHHDDRFSRLVAAMRCWYEERVVCRSLRGTRARGTCSGTTARQLQA